MVTLRETWHEVYEYTTIIGSNSGRRFANCWDAATVSFSIHICTAERDWIARRCLTFGRCAVRTPAGWPTELFSQFSSVPTDTCEVSAFKQVRTVSSHIIHNHRTSNDDTAITWPRLSVAPPAAISRTSCSGRTILHHGQFALRSHVNSKKWLICVIYVFLWRRMAVLVNISDSRTKFRLQLPLFPVRYTADTGCRAVIAQSV
jgi:hypothetical protein